MQMIPPPHATPGSAGPLRKLAALIVTAALVVLVLMFSAVLFAAILIFGTIAGAFLWWKTRELRKQMRDFPLPEELREHAARPEETIRGEVIEGEAVRVEDPRDKEVH